MIIRTRDRGQRPARQTSPGQAAVHRAATESGLPRRVPVRRAVIVAVALLVVAVAAGVSIGPAGVPITVVIDSLLAHLPWHPAGTVPAIDSAIIWQLRLPRVVLGALVGAMLAGGGAPYHGVFRNPLADPYLLGVAAVAGLGATPLLNTAANPALLPPAPPARPHPPPP